MKRLLAIIVFISTASLLFAQRPIPLINDSEYCQYLDNNTVLLDVVCSSIQTRIDLGDYVLKARDAIILKPGFQFGGRTYTGNSFTLAIDPTITNQVTSYAGFPTDDIGTTPALDRSNSMPGTIGGGVDVSPSGAANYQIPIQVSPGSKGMQPRLGIAYSSQAGNGMLGWGWNLTGLSSISRGNKTIYANGKFEPITLTDEDVFYLDGSRLVKASPGVYYPANNPYTKVIKSNNSFTVTTQDGVVMNYGEVDNSSFYTIGGEVPVTYAMNRVTDPDGNYILFIYYGDNLKGDYRIGEIKYTGNSINGKEPYNSIKFYYDKRIDNNILYVAGGKITQNVLLAGIKVFCEGALSKEYKFNYLNDLYSKLSYISYTADGIKYNPTYIYWGKSTNINLQQNDLGFGTLHKTQLKFGDFNGDGLTDVIKFNDSLKTVNVNFGQKNANPVSYNTFNLPTTSATVWEDEAYRHVDSFYYETKDIQTLDYNNDGKDEILYHYIKYSVKYYNGKYSGIASYVQCSKEDYVDQYASNGTHTARLSMEYAASWRRSTTVPEPANAKFNHYFVDYNSDGVIEKVTFKDGVFYACTGLSTSNFPTITGVADIKVMDFDGDGQPDFMTLSSTGYGSIWEFNGTTFVNKLGDGYTTLFGKPANVFIGDFNGDGKSDFLSYNSGWQTKYSNGISFVFGPSGAGLANEAPGSSVQVDGNSTIYKTCTICVDDINNDGKSDIIQAVNGSISIIISNGNVFSNGGTTYIPTGHNTSLFLQWVDYKNNGQKMLIFGNEEVDYTGKKFLTPSFKSVTYLNGPLSSNLFVNAITDGLNNKSTFTYDLFTDNRVFSSSFPKPDFPLALVRGPWQVVSQLTLASPGSATVNVQYDYHDGYSHAQGLGFLGFKTFTSSSSIGVSTVSTFEYTIPNANGIYNTWLKNQTITKGVTSTITNTMELKKLDLDKKSFLPLITKSVSVDGATGITTTNTINSSTGFNESLGRVEKKSTDVNGTIITTDSPYVLVSGNTSKLQSISETKGNYVNSVSFTYESTSSFRVISSATNHGVTTNYEDFNSYGTPQKITVNNGIAHSSSIVYDSYGRFAIQNTDALENISKANYRSCDGAKLLDVNSLGKSTTYGYSFSNGALVSTINTPENNIITSSLEWDNSGTGTYLIQKKLNGIVFSKSYFNARGQKVKDEAAGYRNSTVTNTYTYNADGTLSTETNPAFSKNTSYLYQTDGRLMRIIGLNKDISYNYSGTSVTVTDQLLGTSQKQNFDPLGNITSIISTMGDITYSYSSANKVIEVQTTGGSTKMEYDDFGNQTKLIDPNAGTTTYKYNGYMLDYQEDANGQRITFDYYSNGLLKSKTGKNLDEKYYYDQTAGAKGRLVSVKRDDLTENYSYDEFGRLTQVETVTANPVNHFYTINEYNSFGLLSKVTQPTGLQLQYVYDDALNLISINSSNSGTTLSRPIWEGFKSPTQLWSSYTLGNSLTTSWEYDANYRIQSIKTGANSNLSSVQNLGFTFERNGQLSSRTEGSLVEHFEYDGLNRLLSAKVGEQATATSTYASNGNISATSLAGTYSYDLSHPNAVGSVSWQSGNAQSPSLLTTKSSFTIDNRIDTISNGTYKNIFAYGPSGNRSKVVRYQNSAITSTKLYVGSSEFIYYGSGDPVKRTMIYAPTGICAVYQDSANIKTLNYIHTDYLGSWLKITDQTGNVKFSYSYDAWGRPRNPNTWVLMPVSTTDALTNLSAMQPRFDRGYTGHEHMAGFGLINMNGRLYDPYLQRFLSPDNVVQAPDNEQNYNRYSYCVNNPLMYTDPSGWQMMAPDQGWELDRYFSRMCSVEAFNNMAGSCGGGGGLTPLGGICSIGGICDNPERIFISGDNLLYSSKSGYLGELINPSASISGRSAQDLVRILGAIGSFSIGGVGNIITIDYQEQLLASLGTFTDGPPLGKNVNSVIDGVTKATNDSWDALKMMWDLRLVGGIIPDQISIGFTLSSSFVVGSSVTYSVNLLTRGDAGIYFTMTSQNRFGAEINGGLSLNVSNYRGNPRDININKVLGPTKNVSGGYFIGLDLFTGYKDDKSDTFNPSWVGFGSGVGFTGGVSTGYGYTYKGWF